MRLTVDTNIIFSGIIRDSRTRELLLRTDLDLYAPEYFFTELDNHLEEIAGKASLTTRELKVLLDLFLDNITVTPREEFQHLEEATTVIGHIDPDDVPFLALALHHQADIWSNDNHFQEQNRVRAWKTHEIIEHLSL